MFWIVIFLTVFINNIIPIFAPPTWMVLSAIAVYFKLDSVFLLVLIGAAAATCGRLVLAIFSRNIIRSKFLSEQSKNNIDDLKRHLERRKVLTFGIFLFYAFSPLPSSQLFIAYGLTKMPFKLVAVPFFIGRIISYTVLSLTSLGISKRLAMSSLKTGSFFSIYFVVSQLIFLILIYWFVKIDWHLLFTEKKIKFKNNFLL